MKNIKIKYIGLFLLCICLMGLAFLSYAGEKCEACAPKKPCVQCVETKGEILDPIKSTEPVINTETLKRLINSNVKLTILDARSGKYDDGRRIPGAKSLNSGSNKDEISNLIAAKESLVVTYCTSLTCPASHMLFEHLKKLGYKNVLEYPYGIEGWVKEGNGIEQK